MVKLVGSLEPAARAYPFVDLSNIWGGAREAALAHREDPRAVRLHAVNFQRLLMAGRDGSRGTVVANPACGPALRRYEAAFDKVLIADLGDQSRQEQAADEILQNRIQGRVMTLPDPGTVVLATGDGAGWRQWHGFCASILAARRAGFGIEVAAFRGHMNGAMRELVEVVGGAVIDLDDFYYAITFVEGGRFAQSTLWAHRPTDHPRPWTREEAARVRAWLRCAADEKAA